MPSDRQPVKVFYCYSHKDQALRDDLWEHLSPLRRQGIIEDWHDRRIGPGQEWRRQIDEHLETSQIILLLISSSFIASDYCYDIEMARALERHKAGQARVIPIILRDVFWELLPFGKLQYLPTDAKPVMRWANKDAAFKDIELGIYNVVLELQRTGSTPATPLRATPPPSPHDLRANYLALMAEEWRTLYPVSLDPKAADPYSPRPLTLEQVYVTLDTTTPRPDALRRNEQDEFGWPRPEKPLSALEAMCYARGGHMVLVGEPGSGKTTFARYLALAMAKVLRGSSHLKEEIPGWEGEALLPLFVSLGLFASSLQPTETTGSANLVMDFIRQQINNHPELTGYGESLIRELNNEGRLVIFDGLDEVPDYQRQLTKVAITNFAAVNGRCKVLVTCRRHSYQQKPDWVLNWPEVHELAPLSPSKIGTFIEAWYKALSVRDSTTDYKLKADTLKAALVSEDYRGLAALAANPLMLTVMAIVHTHKSLPSSRVAVYRECIDILMLRWHTAKTSTAKTRTLMEELSDLNVSDSKLRRGIMELAYEALKGGESQHLGGGRLAFVSKQTVESVLITYLDHEGLSKFLAHCQHINGLLMAQGVVYPPDEPQGLSVYAFPHLSFEEYLAALHLRQQIRTAVEHAGDPSWRTVIRFLGESLCFDQEGDIKIARLLIAKLCPERPPKCKDDWQRIWLAGELLPIIQSEWTERQRCANLNLLKRIAQRLVGLVETHCVSGLSAHDWAEAGRTLAKLGDTRPGVSLCEIKEKDPQSGIEKIVIVPEVVWCTVPSGKVILEEGIGTFKVESFNIAKYPITWIQYRRFLEAEDGFVNKVWWDGLPAPKPYDAQSNKQPKHSEMGRDLDNHPAVNVSWYDAVAFCRWLSSHLRYEVRLPLEWEWQQAATGGNPGNLYPWGSEWDANCANTSVSRLHGTTAVGLYPKGSSPPPVGAFDMSGNVWEWCMNKYWYPEEYGLGGKDRLIRVVRGGSWAEEPRYARTTNRGQRRPDLRDISIGFRLACSEGAGVPK